VRRLDGSGDGLRRDAERFGRVGRVGSRSASRTPRVRCAWGSPRAEAGCGGEARRHPCRDVRRAGPVRAPARSRPRTSPETARCRSHLVREHAARLRAEGRPAVRTGEVGCRELRRDEAPYVGADVVRDRRLERDEVAARGGARPDRPRRLAGVVRPEEVLATILDPGDRPAGAQPPRAELGRPPDRTPRAHRTRLRPPPGPRARARGRDGGPRPSPHERSAGASSRPRASARRRDRAERSGPGSRAARPNTAGRAASPPRRRRPSTSRPPGRGRPTSRAWRRGGGAPRTAAGRPPRSLQRAERLDVDVDQRRGVHDGDRLSHVPHAPAGERRLAVRLELGVDRARARKRLEVLRHVVGAEGVEDALRPPGPRRDRRREARRGRAGSVRPRRARGLGRTSAAKVSFPRRSRRSSTRRRGRPM